MSYWLSPAGICSWPGEAMFVGSTSCKSLGIRLVLYMGGAWK